MDVQLKELSLTELKQTKNLATSDKEYNRDKHLKRRYGISALDYDALLKAQNSVCAICSSLNRNGNRLSVDHDHKTGKVRGLLCSKCNHGIGIFNDEVLRVKSAMEYLIKYA